MLELGDGFGRGMEFGREFAQIAGLYSFCLVLFEFGIQEIVMLYELGLDDEAEPLVLEFQSIKRLAIAILPIIAGRLRHLFEENAQLYKETFRHSAASDRQFLQITQTDNTSLLGPFNTSEKPKTNFCLKSMI